METNCFSPYFQFFDKAQWSKHTNSWKVDETDCNASLKSLEISFQGDLFALDKSSYKGIYGALKRQLTSKLDDKDCDGFAFHCVPKGETSLEKLIIAVELKSSSYSSHFMDAYKQLVYTYLKMHNLLSWCNGYDCLEHMLIGVIACHPPTDKYLEDFNARQMLGEKRKSDITFIDKMYQASLVGACKSIPLAKIHLLNELSLDAKLQKQRLHLYLHFTENSTDSHSTLDLRKVLNGIRP